MFSDNEELMNLVKEAKNGKKTAAQSVIRALEPKVRSVSSYYSKKFDDGQSCFDDFAQEARIAISNALESYEIGRGSFLMYAECAMRIAIRKYINDSYRLIRQPKGKNEKVSRLNKALADFAMDGSLSPSDKDLMAKTGFSEKELREVTRLREMSYISSLDISYNEDESDDLDSRIPDPAVSIDDYIEFKEFSNALMSSISPESRYLICSLYGAMGYEKKSVKELSAELSVTGATIRNRKNSIFEKIRTAVA